MKTTIVKSSFNLSEQSIFGLNKAHRANIVHDRERTTSGIYSGSLDLYMNQTNRAKG